MRDVHIGTKVFTRLGDVATVSGEFYQGYRDTYRITLQDRTYIDVSDNHLNNVYRYNEDRKCREDFVIETRDLIQLWKTSRFKLRIDIPSVDWTHKIVPIDPYLLGALLGDGSFQDNSITAFTNSEEDVINKVDTILRRDWKLYLKRYNPNKPDFGICNLPECISRAKLREAIIDLDLNRSCLQKHIPKCYLYNSRDVRLQLLQGLYDTDGYTDERGYPSFTTSSKQLSDDFAFLVRSLGIRDTISITANPKYTDGRGKTKYSNNPSYTHYLKVPDDLPYYSSIKHRSRYKHHQNSPMRNIVSISKIGKEECKCIMVDDSDHTFIATDGFIPTHNTTLGRALAHKLNHNDSNIIEVDAASNNGVDSVRQLISQMQTYPVGSKYKIFILDECHAFSQAAWQIFLKVLEDVPANTVNVFCTTNPEKIPATILSRVQTFQLSKISLSGITNRLKYVLDSEISEGKDIRYDMDAVGYIAKLANGGMRDALTLLDKALTYSNDISLENISKSLNIPNYDDYFELLNACAKKDNVNITRIVNNVYNSGVNFVSWFTGFHSFIINIMKYIFLQDIKETMIPSYYEDKISKYSVKHSAVCLKLASKVLKMNNELKTAVYLQEVALTYLCS